MEGYLIIEMNLKSKISNKPKNQVIQLEGIFSYIGWKIKKKIKSNINKAIVTKNNKLSQFTSLPYYLLLYI